MDDREQSGDLRQSAQEVTFISTQGGSTQLYEHAGKLVAVHTPTSQRIWTHDQYRRYMDVDPLDEDRVLFVAGERTEDGDIRRVAVVLNWRTGEELVKFAVPWDTHDVDHVAGQEYAVADIDNHTAYIQNVSSGETVWRYDFRSDFGPADGEHDVSGDWTHLNDVDLYDNDTAVLLSPRDFDRVILVNRSTKEIIWTLGQEDQYDVLHAQHNPVRLSGSPPTVLVADSENDRLVEYRQQNGTWHQTWRYEGGLNWPRDADRLPNGNTLVADTFNDRAIEVNSDGEIVWQHHVSRSPYDVERLQYGDEPTGPPMPAGESTTVVGPDLTRSPLTALASPYVESFSIAYQLVGAWIIPLWAGRLSFLFLCFGAAVLLGWIGLEVAIRIPADPEMGQRKSGSTRFGVVGGGALMAFGIALAPLVVGPGTALFGTLSIVLFSTGFWLSSSAVDSTSSISVQRLVFSMKVLLLGGGSLFALALLAKMVFGFRPPIGYPHSVFVVAVMSVLYLLVRSQPALIATVRRFSS